MALVVRASVNLTHTVLAIAITRKEPHAKLKRANWYEYQAKYVDMDDKTQLYSGRLAHAYDNGAVALIQKVTKDIVRQQKEGKRNAKNNSSL